MPRQASLATSCSAVSRGIWSRVVSQYRAVTWARPTIATLSRRGSASSRPASCSALRLVIGAHPRPAGPGGRVGIRPGALLAHLADHLGALLLASFQPLPDRGLVAEVRLEHQ